MVLTVLLSMLGGADFMLITLAGGMAGTRTAPTQRQPLVRQERIALDDRGANPGDGQAGILHL